MNVCQPKILASGLAQCDIRISESCVEYAVVTGGGNVSETVHMYLFETLKEKIAGIFRKKPDDKGRRLWNGETENDCDITRARLYFDERCKAENAGGCVDDATCSDLDMDDVFRKLDRCCSPVGQQYLYSTLRCGADNDTGMAYDNYEYFIAHPEVREKIQRRLLALRRRSANWLVKLLFSELPDKPGHFSLFPLSAAAMFAFCILTWFKPVFLLAVIALSITNIIIHRHYTYRIIAFLPSFHDLGLLLSLVHVLPELAGNHAIPQVGKCREHAAAARAVSKKLGWLNIDTTQLMEPFPSIIEYLNVFFLMYLISFFRSVHLIKQYQAELRDMFDSVASIDAAISVASYLNSLPFYTQPSFNGENVIDAEDLYHPLLDEPVANSFRLREKSCLITGSNMAGKTTFMKTVGLNIILGKNLGFCLARRASLPDVTVRSTIKRSDSIGEHKSYYFKEIESILEFLEAAGNGSRHLFLIDEIFRGTNTVERLSAATAVLDSLSERNMVIVTTHDIELEHMLGGNFEMFHFSEMIRDGEHYFDYRIKAGPCTTRNAIRLLALKGYPESVIGRALEISQKISGS